MKREIIGRRSVECEQEFVLIKSIKGGILAVADADDLRACGFIDPFAEWQYRYQAEGETYSIPEAVFLNIAENLEKARKEPSPPTPAEFDVVAEKLGYFKSEHVLALSRELEKHRQEGESRTDTLRRIIAERDEYKAKYEATFDNIKKHLEMVEWSHTIELDGVTYRGNEETIGKLNSLNDCYRSLVDSWDKVVKAVDCTPGVTDDDRVVEVVSDLKRQLAEAKEQSSPPMPDKWRKALSDKRVHGACPDVGYAAKLLVDAFRDKYMEPKYTVLCAIAHLLNWYCNEAEKGTGQ